VGDPWFHGGIAVARVIVVAEHHADSRDAAGGDGPTFQLKERVTSADMRDPHVAAQLIERIGWALADAEHEESRRAAHPDPGARPA
jgi:hypothetical protein